MDAGMGQTHINKFLAAMNMPTLGWRSYKKHEAEVGKVAEQLACEAAIILEKELTVKNIKEVLKLL